MKRALAFILVLTIWFSLAGCGGTGQSISETTAPDGGAEADTGTPFVPAAAYGAREILLPEGVSKLGPMVLADGAVWLCGGAQEDEYANTLYELDPDGAVSRSFRLAGVSGRVADLCPGPEGTLWIMAVRRGEDSYQGGAVCRFDPEQGVVLDSFELPLTATDAVRIRFDEARGCLYVSTYDLLLVLDTAGRELFRLECGDCIAMTTDGTLAGVVFGQSGPSLRLLDFDGRRWGPASPLEGQDLPTLWDGGGSVGLWLDQGGRLYALDTRTAVRTEVLSWLDAGVSWAAYLACQGDGTFLVLDGNEALRRVSPRAEGEDGPQTVTAACFGGALEQAVLAFNNSQDQYRVQLADYSQYNDEANPYDTAGLEQLGLDIAAGDGPDVLDLTDLPVERYVRLGLLEDLYPYIDGDPDLDRAELDQGLLAAMETDGALYELVPVSQVICLESAQALPALRWSAIAALTDGDPFNSLTNAGVLLPAAVCGAGSPFLDWERGTCSFDGPEFAALLTLLARMLPENAAIARQDVDGSRTLLSLAWVQGAHWLAADSRDLGMDGTPPVLSGLPGRDGGQYLLVPQSYDLGISALSAHKDGAWAFLRFCLTQQDTGMSGVGQRAGRHLLTAYQDTSRGPIPDWPSGTMDVEPEPFYDAVDAAFAAAGGVLHADQDILNVIREQLAALREGGVSADEAASAVQERVSLYLSERG